MSHTVKGTVEILPQLLISFQRTLRNHGGSDGGDIPWVVPAALVTEILPWEGHCSAFNFPSLGLLPPISFGATSTTTVISLLLG